MTTKVKSMRNLRKKPLPIGKKPIILKQLQKERKRTTGYPQFAVLKSKKEAQKIRKLEFNVPSSVI